MRTAICDDEREAAEGLKKLILEWDENADVDIFTKPQRITTSEKVYDVIFLDICMPGLSGIDFAKEMRKFKDNTRIVFVTGAKEYVFEAFDVAAYHYLMKPVNVEKLHSLLDRIEGELVTENPDSKKIFIDPSAWESGQNIFESDGQIFIRTRWNSFCLNRENILYVESQRKKCEIFTTDETVECYSTMTAFEGLLGNSFFRSHRGFLVNMDKITGFTKDTIDLEDGSQIYLSKKRYANFVKTYLKHMKQSI